MKNSVTFISASAITERRKSKNSIYASVLELRFFDDEEFGFKFPLDLHKRAKKKVFGIYYWRAGFNQISRERQVIKNHRRDASMCACLFIVN